MSELHDERWVRFQQSIKENGRFDDLERIPLLEDTTNQIAQMQTSLAIERGRLYTEWQRCRDQIRAIYEQGGTPAQVWHLDAHLTSLLQRIDAIDQARAGLENAR